MPFFGFPMRFFLGADNQIRTGDLILTKDALYLLSYISIFGFCRALCLLNKRYYNTFFPEMQILFKKNQNFFKKFLSKPKKSHKIGQNACILNPAVL